MANLAKLKLDPVIAKLETARSALVLATSPKQVKQIADVAASAEIYARRQQLGEEAIGYAHALKIYALAKLGALLEPMTKATGGDAQRTRFHCGIESPPTLAALLQTDRSSARKTSMVACQLAALPDATVQAIAAREVTLTEARRQVVHRARPALALPDGTYRVLYADPPWRYRDSRAGLGGDSQRVDRAETAAAQDYPTMTVEDLGKLDVAGLAHTDAVLFCWATFPLLPDALNVLTGWRFTYKTAFVWQKPRGSFGHYHKADAELLLVSTRGSCTPDTDQRESQVLTAPAAGHSRKPQAARELIDRLYPHGPRIELFARQAASGGWQTWGNEP